MSEVYPFPVPKAIKDCVSHELAIIAPPWHGIDYMELRPDDPAVIQCAYHWHYETAPLLSAIDDFVRSLNPGSYEDEDEQRKWRTLSAQVAAVELRFKQFEALLEWASRTWKYDPRIRAEFKTECEPQGETSGETETARPVQ